MLQCLCGKDGHNAVFLSVYVCASSSEGAAKQWCQPRSGQRGWIDSPPSGTHIHPVMGVASAVRRM